jgi:very-short-patch-repair endonuclease
MGYPDRQEMGARVWKLAERQYGVVAREQLLELGFRPQGIKHRVAKGRLHPLWRGVYAVGRPQISKEGRWMAAVLTCGPHAILSHGTAAALWKIRRDSGGPIDVTTPPAPVRSRPGIRIRRCRTLTEEDLARRDGIPVTSPARTLIDLSTQLSPSRIERAINEADKLDLIDPESLRSALEDRRGQRGVRALREILDRATFTLTDSELERRFLRIIPRAGLAEPLTQQAVNGFRVDFFWPDLGLVVETDGLRYHRTPTQQQSDRIRDQAHAKAGLTPLRFTHAQVAFESRRVEAVLGSVASRLGAGQMRL